ncbi:hypothetical protein CRM22_004367 [Opisthorchis felineus]|uniref:Uncharacterized protein n=1 Tax=Opisthorchis felineus TaxID=147828 RepID=A0A4S2M325_OPIFE|nr:hypothetical protein CRM22_004367 [Opisthorchis felineus]
MVKHNLRSSDIVRTICLISMGLCVELDCLIVQKEYNSSCKALAICLATNGVPCEPRHIWTTRLFCLLEGKQYAMQESWRLLS